MSIHPSPPKQGEPKKTPPPTVNPDPKAHPIHPETPPEPIQEGTDPRRPIAPSRVQPGDAA
jgi:hypothetical protein